MTPQLYIISGLVSMSLLAGVFIAGLHYGSASCAAATVKGEQAYQKGLKDEMSSGKAQKDLKPWYRD